MIKYNNNSKVTKIKRMVLFSIVMMMTITTAIAPPQKVPGDITQEATGILTNVPDLGMPTGVPQGSVATRVPTGNDFPVGSTNVEWTISNIGVIGTQVVTITHNNPPVITVNGGNPITVNIGDVYTDSGATAKDAVDGTFPAIATGTVDTSTVGTYTITYTATDSAGNVATQKTRTVNVEIPVVQVLTTITVSPASATAIVGGTKQFGATCKDQNAVNMVCPTLIWSSSNTLVGTIDSAGLLTAISGGTTSITASDGIIVSNPPSVATISPAAIKLAIISFTPNSTVEDAAPSNIKFNITMNQVANVVWSLDGVSTPGGQSVTTDSYRTNIPTISSHVLIVTAQNGTDTVSQTWNWNVKGTLEVHVIHPSTGFINIGQPTNVTFKVDRKCGIEPSDDPACVGTRVPVTGGAGISLSGIVTGSGTTNSTTGELIVPVNTTANGTINVTASKSGYVSGYTNITVGIAPTPTPAQPSSSGGGGGGSSGGSSSGGGGGGGTAEPYDNIYKYEIQEHNVFTTPVSFKYVTPELGVYEVMVTSLQSDIAALRIEILRGTSKLVGMPAPGIVYKNLNAWMDYKRIKNATIRFKVENSWINSNGLSAENIKMSKWDNSSKRWTELLTNKIDEKDGYTYFESQTNSFSSFAISGIKTSPTATFDSSTPGMTNSSNTSSTPIDADLTKRKDYTKLEIGVVGIVIVLIFYMLRIKKKE